MLNQSKDTTCCPPDVSVDNQASLNPVLCTVALTKSSWERTVGTVNHVITIVDLTA